MAESLFQERWLSAAPMCELGKSMCIGFRSIAGSWVDRIFDSVAYNSQAGIGTTSLKMAVSAIDVVIEVQHNH